MQQLHLLYSPRPWGCFLLHALGKVLLAIFPTPVGVFLNPARAAPPVMNIPHARGGVSRQGYRHAQEHAYSPRPWGCFWPPRPAPYLCPIFPTPVGVFLNILSYRIIFINIPHARGGVSHCAAYIEHEDEYSPRPWGCFYAAVEAACERLIFPTPVGVFLGGGLAPVRDQDIPHARGGVSKEALMRSDTLIYSPRPWGCFSFSAPIWCRYIIFPTPVGVFPKGGVYLGAFLRYSPRPWGCFRYTDFVLRIFQIFPTPVGVFPSAGSGAGSADYIPHARGGVSEAEFAAWQAESYSPRPWGCF